MAAAQRYRFIDLDGLCVGPGRRVNHAAGGDQRYPFCDSTSGHAQSALRAVVVDVQHGEVSLESVRRIAAHVDPGIQPRSVINIGRASAPDSVDRFRVRGGSPPIAAPVDDFCAAVSNGPGAGEAIFEDGVC